MSDYPKRPANMPKPVHGDGRIKVNLYYYATEAEARIAGDYFDELGKARMADGYDFGYWTTGFHGKKTLPEFGEVWLAVEG